MTTVNALCGGVTSSTARITAKVTGSGNIRVAYATNADLIDPEYSDAVATTLNVATVDVAGLAGSTRHWYAIEDAGVLDTSYVGTFRTHPQVGSQASHSVIVSGCAGSSPEYPGSGVELAPNRVSNHPAFSTMAQHPSDPELFVHMGDRAYYDPGSGVHVADTTLTTYRRMYDDVALQSNQAALHKAMPIAYTFDDHDFGPNDSDSTATGRDNACLVYRERMPSYPLPAGGGSAPIYQAWQIGRVQYILSDTRSARTPNVALDDGAKTMLGSAQKAWIRQTLETTSAEALVWLMPTPWLGSNEDSWASFTVERGELVAMLHELGWTNRMVMVTADSHALGLCSGPGNPYGGFPLYQFASLDSTPSTSTGPQYDLGFLPGRGQYGTVGISDRGDSIVITGTGYTAATVWRSHSITIDLSEPPPPAPPPVAVARRRTAVTWLGCELESGQIIAELSDVTGTVSRVLGAATSANLKIPIPSPKVLRLVEAATDPGATMVVLVVNDVPTWAGAVLTSKGGSDGVLDLAVVSLEGLLDRSYVGDHAWTAHDEASVIAAGLVGDANRDGAGFVVDAPATGVLRNRVYYDRDDVTVLAALQELMSVQGGPEFTVDLDWTDSTQTAVSKIVRIHPRIGLEAATPDTVFTVTAPSTFASRGSSEATYTYTKDYSEGRGARYVIATGDGEGESRPQSDPQSVVPAGRFRWEHRFSPPGGVKDIEELNAHARAELVRLLNGSETWEVQARWDASPRLNVDWRLGDDVAWDLTGHRHPDGVIGQGRDIAWEFDPRAGTVNPTLITPGADIRPPDEVQLMKSDTWTGTPNSSGYATITHDAGFTPANVLVQGEAPDTGSNIPTQIIRDQITETTFRVRVLDQDGNVITTQVTLGFTCFEG